MIFASSDVAHEISDWFDQNIEKMAFRLELRTDKEGYEHILWHGIDNGENRVFTVDPYTNFWLCFKIGFMGLLSIESQL